MTGKKIKDKHKHEWALSFIREVHACRDCAAIEMEVDLPESYRRVATTKIIRLSGEDPYDWDWED